MEKTNNRIDFICVGAQKAGTTWLYERLKELPEFSLPPIKELHYFDRSRKYPSPNILSDTQLYKRLLNIGWIKHAGQSLLKAINKKDYDEFKWQLKWHFSNIDDNWYLSLFDSLSGIKGEINPDYSILNESDIERMHKMMPDSKIIFLLRNPVERVWSHYRFNKYVLKLPDLNSEEIKLREIIYFANKEGVELRTNYLQTLSRFKKFYPSDQILIGFYDAIINEPEKLLSEIVSFLRGDSSMISEYCNLEVKNNTSPKVKMPKEVETYLKGKYNSLIKELSDTYGSYCEKWYVDLYDDKKSKMDYEILPPTLILDRKSIHYLQ